MKNLLTTLIILILLISSYLFAQENNSEQSHGSSPLEELNYLRNNNGFDFEFNYKGEIFSNLAGGMESNSTYLDNFDIVFDMDFDELLGWKGARLNTHILGNHGGDPTEYAGAAQGISNIAATETWKLYQFWLEQNLFDDKLSVLFGLYDLNSEFDVRETSGFFINPSHGIGAEYALTGLNGPSIFPYTSLTLRVNYSISSSFDIKAAVFDGVPGDLNKPTGTHIKFNKDDGLLLSTEVSYRSETEEFASGYFRYAAGGWYYTREFEKLETNSGDILLQKGNYGAYISAENFLIGESQNSSQGLSAFVRLGFADQNVNQVDTYYGAGLTYTGLIPGRDEDVLGIAISSSKNNQKFIDLMAEKDFRVESYEHIVELTYVLNVAGWLKIQPDVQYVFNPTFCNCNTYSFIYGTRFELAL